MRIILASQSQIRKRAMDVLGLKYECIAPNINEKAIRDADPIKMAEKLSEAKARAVGEKESGIVIASDAFLVFKGEVLEKPQTMDEAFHMLKKLSGSKYTFVTGLAVYEDASKYMQTAVTTCDIRFRLLSDHEIRDYIARYPVLNFAGAHETDGVVRFADKIEGSCNFVTALPMNELVGFLRSRGVHL